MRLSLNLDEYLKQFHSLTFCQELLEKYYDQQLKKYYDSIGVDYDSVEKTDGLLILDDMSKYYYYTDNTEDYYQEKVESRFPILYRLVQNIIVPSISIGDKEYTPTWKDWYYIALNAYNLRGNIRSIYYIFTYLGIEILEQRDPKTNAQIEFYDKNYLDLKLSVALKTDSPILTRKDIYALCRELLLVQTEKLKIEILYINYLVQNKSYLYVNTYTNRFPKVEDRFFIDSDSESLYEHFNTIKQTPGYPNIDGIVFNTNYVDFMLNHLHQKVKTDVFTDFYYPKFYMNQNNTNLSIIPVRIPDIRKATNTFFVMNLDNIYQPDFFRSTHVEFTINTPDISYPTNNIILMDTDIASENTSSSIGTNLSNYEPTFQF